MKAAEILIRLRRLQALLDKFHAASDVDAQHVLTQLEAELDMLVTDLAGPDDGAG